MKRGNVVDRVGLRYGRLTVVKQAGRASDGHVLWACVCDCGNECLVQSNNFRDGDKRGTQSCGCLRREVSSKPKKPWNVGMTYQNHGDERVYKNKKAWANAVVRVRGAACERCGWDKARCDVHHRVARCDGGLFQSAPAIAGGRCTSLPRHCQLVTFPLSSANSRRPIKGTDKDRM